MATTPLSQAILAGLDPSVYRPLSDITQGQDLIKQGMDGSPTTGWGVAGRLASALSGSLISNSAASELAKTIATGKSDAMKRDMAVFSGAGGDQPVAPVPQAPPALSGPPASAPFKVASVGDVAPPSTAPRAPVQSSPKVWGDAEAEAAGLYEPKSGSPPVPQQLAQGPAGVQPSVPAQPAAKPQGPSDAQLWGIIHGDYSSEASKALALGVLKERHIPKPDAFASSGEGHVLNTRTGETKEGYKPSNATAGFEPNPDGSGLRPIPGGPTSMEYLRQRSEALSGARLDDQTVGDMAKQYLAGDRTVLQNLGRGAQGAENVVKLRQEISKQARDSGLDPKDVVNVFNEQAGALAGQRAVGTRAANISLAANEANNMIPIALEASDKLPRTQYMPWNQMVQSVQKGSSSPELASFVAATNSLVNSYVRAVSPSGVPTDSMREHAYSMLNAAQGPEAYKAVVRTMQLEMKAALQAPGQVKEELRINKPTGEHATPSAPAAAAVAAPAVPAEGAIAVNPTTKERLIFQSGKWVPVT